MSALFSVSQIRLIESAALGSLPPGTLMRRAGEAAAKFACDILAQDDKQGPILALVGPGNNGGDALEAAAILAHSRYAVTALLCATPTATDARNALNRAKAAGVHCIQPETAALGSSGTWSLVIDGLFGIGLARPLTGTYRSIVEQVNALHCPILALDVPSGLNADTGAIIGPDGIAVHASHTITFLADKPGLHTGEGRDYAGLVEVAPLDVAPDCVPPACIGLNTESGFSTELPRRRHNTHKGTYGNVIAVGGDCGMSGAIILAARAALQCGAGRVFAAFLAQPPSYDSRYPELMCRSAHDIEFTDATIAIGPGLGTSENARNLLAKAISGAKSLVIDADALNILAADTSLQQALPLRAQPALLTPHPLEAARLLGCSAATIQMDRIHAARTLARQLQSIIVLKGSGTVIAAPGEEIRINPTGNAALATAGTGDVLTGICAALLAQGISPWTAALAAVWLHGRGAEDLVAAGIGPAGMTASELIPAVRTALNRVACQH